MAKKYILKITPQTHVRATQGDKIFFRIPREKLFPSGLKRLLRLEKYNKYKEDLLAMAKSKSFVIPDQGMSIIFHIPCPKSWKPWQKEVMDGKLHQAKPDLDNLMKALGDSLLDEDKKIGHYSMVCKKWTMKDHGWIEIQVDEPKIPVLQLPTSQKKYISSLSQEEST